MPREAEALGAVALPQRGPPCGAVRDDERDREERLDVVDDRRLAEEARFGREGGLGARHGPTPLERLHERRLFSEHEAARASPDFHVYRKVAGKDAIAHESPPPGLLHGVGHALGREMRLAVNVEVNAGRLRCVRCEERALEEPVRIALHEVAVLEDSGLALFGVDDEVRERAARAAGAFPLERR